MKFRKFNRGDYMETERKTHVKMHKSGKNWVTTVMSQLKFLNIFGNHLSQINQVSDEDNHSMRSLSYHTAKSVMTIGAFLGGGAIFTPHVQAEELPAVKELDHETLGQAESEILSGSEKTSTSETSNSRSEATSQSLKSEYDQKSEDISQSEQMSNSQSESLSISESTSESLSMTVSDSVKYSQSEEPSSADSSVSIYSDSLNNSSSISSNTLSKSNMESDSNSSLETLSETDSRDTTSESQINGSQISNSTQSTANHVINEKEQVSQATDVVNLTTPVENQQAQLNKSTKQNISVENSKNIDHLLDEVNIAKPKSVTTVLKRYASSFAPRTAAINLAAVSTTNTSGQTTYTFTKEDLLGTSVATNRRNVTNPESYNLINNITAVYNPSTGVISWTITTKSPSWFGNYRDAENVYTNLNIATDSRTGLGNPTNVKVNGQNALVTTWEQAKPYNGTDYGVTFPSGNRVYRN